MHIDAHIIRTASYGSSGNFWLQWAVSGRNLTRKGPMDARERGLSCGRWAVGCCSAPTGRAKGNRAMLYACCLPVNATAVVKVFVMELRKAFAIEPRSCINMGLNIGGGPLHPAALASVPYGIVLVRVSSAKLLHATRHTSVVCSMAIPSSKYLLNKYIGQARGIYARRPAGSSPKFSGASYAATCGRRDK